MTDGMAKANFNEEQINTFSLNPCTQSDDVDL